MGSEKGPTLTDAKGLGGIIALDGFDYQVWDALIRLPAWLRNPAFEGMAIEVLEDVEARFFAPHSPHGHLLERLQAKSATLGRPDLIEVFQSFKSFDAAHPGTARMHTLVTPALPAKLTWVARDTGRVRRARPFYRPFAGIQADSDEKLRTDLIEEFGHDLGGYIASSVEISARPVADRAHAEALFGAELYRVFPSLDVGPRRVHAAFSALSDLCAQSRGVLLPRAQLLALLGKELQVTLFGDDSLLLHVRSDRNGEAEDALELDASALSGGAGGFPVPAHWKAELLEPLDATARWAAANRRRRIVLTGSYRLTTAFVLGSAFRSATGFEMEIQTRSGTWATDNHPAAGTALPWSIAVPHRLVNHRLVVSIGVLRDPLDDVCRTLQLSDAQAVLSATLPQALTNGEEAQASVQAVKAAIGQASAALRPQGVDLFYVGPAAFAVALGHRWNAMPPTQLHEFLASEGQYKPTAVLG